MPPRSSKRDRRPTAFISYARVDAPTVTRFTDYLKAYGVDVGLDVEFLRPGEQFEDAILQRIRNADALVAFISPASMKSAWVDREVRAFAEASGRHIFPVLMAGSDFTDLPPVLARYQAIRLRDESEIPAAASELAQILLQRRPEAEPLSPEAEQRAVQWSSDIATNIRKGVSDDASVPSNAVSLVHGHDHAFRDEIHGYLRKLGVDSVVLSKLGGTSKSLLDKFETFAHQARFAVILLSPDDMGASRLQYEDPTRGGEKTLKYRARENVILELGFFYGRLGWDRVFVVQKSPEYVWPDFERPSDLDGAVFVEVSGESDWRDELAESLRKAGLIERDGD